MGTPVGEHTWGGEKIRGLLLNLTKFEKLVRHPGDVEVFGVCSLGERYRLEI